MTMVTNPSFGHSGSGAPLVIGIGSSDGGREALRRFFSGLPGGSGWSFVVLQSLSPDNQVLTADRLAECTQLPVCQAASEAAVEPDTVYVVPPKKIASVQGGRFTLSDCPFGLPYRPIDAFFTALAREEQERAIVAVLSGTGSDGMNGAKAVKEYGGFVLVQAPETAAFGDMPKNVIQAGLPDLILPPEEMAGEILKFSAAPPLLRMPKGGGAAAAEERLCSGEETLSHVYAILRSASGIDFTYYKRATILRRIERRMLVTHSADLMEYARLLVSSSGEVSLLVREILIGVTSFFRDAAFFEKLKCSAICEIVERAGETEPIRVWTAGCSTGEEAYSIAILFQEVLDELQVKRDIKIFATDVDSRAIERASKGFYAPNIVADLTPDRLSRFFVEEDGGYLVSKQIRQMIVFTTHNMFSDPPFGKLDLISCRNVMIYFQPVLCRSLFAMFHTALKNNGFLFLGKSETAGEYADLFKPVCGPEKIYLHWEGSREETLPPPTFQVPGFQSGSRPAVCTMAPEPPVREAVYTRFLEAFLPASVVLDEGDTVIHFFGNYTDFFTLAPGKATLNFFSMLNKDLVLAASTALSRCREEKTPVTYTDVVVDCPSGRKVIDLAVQPVPGEPEEEGGLTAVLFLEHKAAIDGGPTEKYNVDATAARRIADLERKFRASQSDLHATTRRLEAVNGELQAVNEELLTANEELQSSTEELQSVNEELYTVNTEHQLKLDELTTMTNDLSNFLSSTMIGILFVDSKLNIRKFTEYVGREFQLMEHDIGRPIQIFAHSFPDEDIERDASIVLKDLISIDREVTAMNDRCYTLRIAPFRTTEDSIRGLVITIIDSLGKAGKDHPLT